MPLSAFRNFPQGTISDMVADVSQGIAFVCNCISDYGGDPNRYQSYLCTNKYFFNSFLIMVILHVVMYRVYLMGQSAGAHISSCALLEQAIKESQGEESILWSVSQIKAYFGLSGG